mgnify:CR=1 FL=1
MKLIEEGFVELLFGRKNRKDKKSGIGSLNKEFLPKLDGRQVKYVSMRKGTESGETILGKDGIINIIDNNEVSILCDNKTVFRHSLENLVIDELMSLEGVNFRYEDEYTGENFTVIAYYKYYRK